MNYVTMILTGLMMLALVIMMAPNILALNKGKMLRNIALWLAIALGLAIIYINFHPVNSMPPVVGVKNENNEEAPTTNPEPSSEENSNNSGEDIGYTPPSGD